MALDNEFERQLETEQVLPRLLIPAALARGLPMSSLLGKPLLAGTGRCCWSAANVGTRGVANNKAEIGPRRYICLTDSVLSGPVRIVHASSVGVHGIDELGRQHHGPIEARLEIHLVNHDRHLGGAGTK